MNKEKVKRILDAFDDMYPDAQCELVHHNELELLIAVMLSAQTTDASVNKLTQSLFQKYRCVEDYANAPLSQLEADLRTIGLYRNKAKNVKAMAQKLIDDFDGQVPCDHDALQTLPGVGRKTANVVISEGFKVPAIAVDTHVERISKRLGFAFKKDSVLTVETSLLLLVSFTFSCVSFDFRSFVRHVLISMIKANKTSPMVNSTSL